jgi:hypothetical protein
VFIHCVDNEDGLFKAKGVCQDCTVHVTKHKFAECLCRKGGALDA